MRKLLAAVIIMCILISVLPCFALAFSGENGEFVFASGAVFYNEDDDVVYDLNNAEMLYSSLTLKASAPIDYAYSIMAYCKGKLLAMETVKGTAAETPVIVTTPKIEIDDAIKEDINVKVLLTSSDFSRLLAPEGNLGSYDASVKEVYIGDYRLKINPENSEYEVKRYLTEDKFPIEVNVVTGNLATKASITESEEDGKKLYSIRTVSNDETVEEVIKVSLKAFEVDEVSLKGIEVNGKAIENFDPKITCYTVDVSNGVVPEISVFKYDSEASVDVLSADAIPGTTEIKVEKGGNERVYQIIFREIKTSVIKSSIAIEQFGNRTNSAEASYGRIVAGNEPMGNTSADKVSYYLFDNAPDYAECVGASISTIVRDADGAGFPHTLYVYDSIVDSIDNIAKITPSFKELKDGSAKEVGLFVARSKDVNTALAHPENITLKNNDGKNQIILGIRKLASDVNGNKTVQVRGSGELSETSLSISYAVDEAENKAVLSENGFEDEILNEAPPEGELSLSISDEWTNDGDVLALRISIEGNTGVPGGDMLVKAFKEDDQSKEYIYLSHHKADENGNVDIGFNVSADAGEYTFEVSSDFSSVSYNTKLYIPSVNKMNELIGGLKQGSFTGETLTVFLKENMNDLSIENSLFSKLGKETGRKACEYFISEIEDYSVESIVGLLEKGAAIKGISEKESDEIIELCLGSEAISSVISQDRNYEDYENLKEKSSLFSIFKNSEMNSVEEVNKALYSSLAVVRLKDIAGYSEITEIIENYNEYLSDAVCIEYNSLGKNKRILANKYMVSRIAGINSPEDMNDLISDATKYALKEGTGGSSGGGAGGGGGSSGKGNSQVSLGSISTAVPVPQEKKLLSFKDVPQSYWGYEAIVKLADKGIISGRTNEMFFPEDKITRAEFSKLIVSAVGLTGDADISAFTDVNGSGWYYKYICAAYANNIITGISDSLFAPDENITRQDAAVMVSRAAKLSGDLSAERFTDDGEISEYAREAVYALKDAGILNGYNGIFAPKDNLSRAQAAQLIKNLTDVSK